MFKLLVVLLATSLVSCAIEQEENVLVLTTANFDEALKQYKYLLVEFYAPWCGHCKSLAPEYAKAATVLAAETSASDMKLAKVDATVQSELGERFKVKGYPTLKFFISGEPIEYGGGRTADEIVAWLKKKSGPSAVTLSSVDELTKLRDENEVVVVGVFKDVQGVSAQRFQAVANLVDSVVFAISSEEALFKELAVSADEGMTLYKKFDEGMNVFAEAFEEELIKAFIHSNQLALVSEFNQETAQKIFGGDIKVHTLLFASKKADNYDAMMTEFKGSAKSFKARTIFVLIDTDVDENDRVMEFFGLKKENAPTVRLISLGAEMTKFKPDFAEIKTDLLTAFVTSFFDGKLKPHLLTQEEPADWDAAPVKILVGTNFDRVVKDTSKMVLVEFYAPWCGHCKQLSPIYDELATNFKDNADIVVAKMDSTVNELEDVKVQSFPTIKLWTKDNQIIDYNGERTLEGLTKFINSGGKDGAQPAADAEADGEADEEEEREEKEEL
jgi:protein disulfide-isomerase A1